MSLNYKFEFCFWGSYISFSKKYDIDLLVQYDTKKITYLEKIILPGLEKNGT